MSQTDPQHQPQREGKSTAKPYNWPYVAKSTGNQAESTTQRANLKGKWEACAPQSNLPKGISNSGSILHLSLQLVYLLVVVLQ